MKIRKQFKFEFQQQGVVKSAMLVYLRETKHINSSQTVKGPDLDVHSCEQSMLIYHVVANAATMWFQLVLLVIVLCVTLMCMSDLENC